MLASLRMFNNCLVDGWILSSFFWFCNIFQLISSIRTRCLRWTASAFYIKHKAARRGLWKLAPNRRPPARRETLNKAQRGLLKCVTERGTKKNPVCCACICRGRNARGINAEQSTRAPTGPWCVWTQSPNAIPPKTSAKTAKTSSLKGDSEIHSKKKKININFPDINLV